MDIDYKVWDKYGIKVPVVRETVLSKMENRTLQECAAELSSNVENLHDSYVLDNVSDEEELCDIVQQVGDIKKEYRRVHALIKRENAESFKADYPTYDEVVKKLNGAYLDATQKLRTAKKQRKLRDAQGANSHDASRDGALLRLDEKKLQSKTERKFFVDQADWELKDCDWVKIDEIDEIKSNIVQFERRLETFFKICSELEGLYGDEFKDLGLNDENTKLVTRFREKINSGKARISEIRKNDVLREQQEQKARDDAKAQAEDVRIKQEAAAEKAKVDELIVCAKSLEFEIKTRHSTFKSKCDIKLSDLNDHEVLDLKKSEETFHVELREFIDKVSSFEKFVLPCGAHAADMRKSVTDMRDECTKLLETFLKNVGDAISSRDISEKKLKNAAGLKIELTKFKGYNSEMDIYTFRSEVKKHIEPNVQRCQWADYVKKNYLTGPAYNLVAKTEEIDDIWAKLIEVYGNTQLLLQNKIGSLKKFSNLNQQKDDEKIAGSLTSLLNVMAELSSLAQKYDLEGDLYHGGGLQRILDLMGEQRERKFIKSIAKQNLKNKQKWCKLETFLKDELSEREAYIINDKAKKSLDGEKRGSREKDSPGEKRGSGYSVDTVPQKCVCHICGKSEDHVTTLDAAGKPCIEYIACKKFVDLKTKDRDQLLFKKRLCSKCLTPGVKWNSDHDCDKKHSCSQMYDNKKGENVKCEKHVLVCGFHCKEAANQELLEVYKKNSEKAHKNLKDFSKNVKISHFSVTYAADSEGDREDSSIFGFQQIEVDGVKLNIFYDSGCGDLVVSKDIVDKLKFKGRSKQECDGPILMRGAGGQESTHEHGIYTIKLPLASGKEAEMTGLCVDVLTHPFPKYPLKKVEEDFREEISKINPELLPDLPSLPSFVGGKVDVMIGKQYLKYSPREVAQLESGLTLYKSRFKGLDGSEGVISGPHPEFTRTDRTAHFSTKTCYYSNVVRTYNGYFKLLDEVPLLGNKGLSSCNSDFHADHVQLFPGSDCMGCDVESGHVCSDPSEVFRSSHFAQEIPEIQCEVDGVDVFASKRGPKCLNPFQELDNAGTEISYRCMKCRNCVDCKNASRIEEISLQEEAEQDLIDRSVDVDVVDKHEAFAELPFIADPKIRLAPTNYPTSRKVYNSVIRSLGKDPKSRDDAIKAEAKLHGLGYVGWLYELGEEDRKMINESLIKYFIPWRVVWSKSISTPCRPVFDASLRGPHGCSLNDIVAKGSNNMNNLIQILIRWLMHLWAFHTDIRTMYNRIKLLKPFWCYQLYLWEKDLDPLKEPLIKVIKTLIYGVRSSGNQAERAIRLTAEKNQEVYPKAYDIVHKATYVDDIVDGDVDKGKGMKAVEQLQECLKTGGFGLKSITCSGEDPDESVSSDGKSIMVFGLRWFPKGDFFMVNIDAHNFSRKVRGRKSVLGKGIPDDLTMKDCVTKVAEIFEPLGRLTPIMAGFKLDISRLHRDGFTWDDKLPDNLRAVWVDNTELMEEISRVKFKRAVVPLDAKNLDIMTIDTGDSSSEIICVAIYARFERKDGSFSCQLVFARSKILAVGVTIPRGELMAAHMNAATGHTVKKAFGKYHQGSLKLTDSTVALHWIGSKTIVLKVSVRARVIEIGRLTQCEEYDEADRSSPWAHVDTENMPADIGTRKGAKVEDVIDGSIFANGMPYMNGPLEKFPTTTLEDLKLTQADLNEANKEKIVAKTYFATKSVEVSAHADEQTKLRYKYSDYLLDPNRFRFRKVIRIKSLVLLFIHKLSVRVPRVRENKIFSHDYPGKLPKLLEPDGDKFLVITGKWNDFGDVSMHAGKLVEISDDMLKAALYYYFRKSSAELKHFLDKKKFETMTKEIDEVLYYSGRILDGVAFDGYPELCQVAIDLCPTSFCVPVLDRYSPVAISIALDIHWYHEDVQHTGIESMLRQTESVAHIIGGRSLVRSIKDGCKKCRILNKESVDVVMGPLQNVNLCIAPPFYASQVDIFGPFKSYSSANKRATIKVWFSIFCCCTTGAVDIRVMEDYSTDSFVSGFIRFSCRYGYPKYVLPDAGSQLVKGCESMSYSFTDTKLKLSTEYGVQFVPCPVGAHYIHGKVERKIREVKKCVALHADKQRLSVVQWETLMQQIANSVNNHPIGLRNYTKDLENLDLITPNRLILGRNNERCPNSPLTICPDHKQLIENNAKIFRAWFKAWLVSYLPSLIERPKWHKTDREMQVGDIVLFLKSDREFDEQYQYGIVSSVHKGQDGHVRKVDVEYRNASENARRTTTRGVRDLVNVSPIDELDIYERLDQMID